jgi:hypothetical protein
VKSFDSAKFPRLKVGYESYYLCARHPDGTRAVWIRYTVHKAVGGPANGSVWCTLFRPDGARAVAEAIPGLTHGDVWLGMGAAHISPGVARGSVTGADWDIGFVGHSEFHHLPFDVLYSAPIPKTKAVSTHPSARFTGTLTLDTDTIDLSGWGGMVGHNWGAQHAERWIWTHAQFDEGWLDLILGRVKLAGRITPWVAMGGLSLNGNIQRIGRAIPGRGVIVRERPDGCEFELPGGIRGEVHAPLSTFVGWRYADPDGSTHDVVNCSIAELTIASGGRSYTGAATYELGMREQDHGVTIQPFLDR